MDNQKEKPVAVFISNSALARIFGKVPDEVLENCILFFGSGHKDIFGKADEKYD